MFFYLSKVRFIQSAGHHAQIFDNPFDDILELGSRELKTRLVAAIAIACFNNQGAGFGVMARRSIFAKLESDAPHLITLYGALCRARKFPDTG